jgi:endonuclease III-like uncharacterized protein
VSDLFQTEEKIAVIVSVIVVVSLSRWKKANTALSEFAARDHFGLQLICVAEEQALANSNFSSGANQTFPLIRFLRHLASEQNFDASAKKITRCGIDIADWVRLDSHTPPVQTRRKHAGIIQNQQIIRS